MLRACHDFVFKDRDVWFSLNDSKSFRAGVSVLKIINFANFCSKINILVVIAVKHKKGIPLSNRWTVTADAEHFYQGEIMNRDDCIIIKILYVLCSTLSFFILHLIKAYKHLILFIDIIILTFRIALLWTLNRHC